MSDLPLSHLEVTRAVAFLLRGVPLTSEEHAHLLQCADCRLGMVHAAVDELNIRGASERRDPLTNTMQDAHLSEDRLVELACDSEREHDVSRAEDEHLENCSQCFGKLVQIVTKLQQN